MTREEYERHVAWLESVKDHDITADADTGQPLYASKRWYTFENGRLQIHHSYAAYLEPCEITP